MHRTSNVMGSLVCTELAKRGFMVLYMNPRSDNNEASVKWEPIALDVKSGVQIRICPQCATSNHRLKHARITDFGVRL